MGTFAVSALKWLWSRKWYVLIIIAFSVCLIALGVRLWRANDRANDYQRQLANYDAVVQIHEGAYLQQTAQLELAETLIREYSPQPTTELAYTAGVKVIYKTRTVKVPVVETRIEYRDKYIEITGKPSTPADTCADGSCTIDLTYTLAPLKIDLFVTRIKGRYQTIADAHRDDVTLELSTKLDPKVFQDDRQWFAGIGPLVRLHGSKADYSWHDLGLAAEVGYLFSAWYIKGQVMYFDGFGAGVIFGGRW